MVNDLGRGAFWWQHFLYPMAASIWSTSFQDMDDFQKINSIYSTYFTEQKPARSTVAVRTLPKHARIEIEAIAFVP